MLGHRVRINISSFTPRDVRNVECDCLSAIDLDVRFDWKT